MRRSPWILMALLAVSFASAASAAPLARSTTIARARWVDADPNLSQILFQDESSSTPGEEIESNANCALPVGGTPCDAFTPAAPTHARALTDFGVNRVFVRSVSPVNDEATYSAQAISEWQDDFTYAGRVPGSVTFVFETVGSWSDAGRVDYDFGLYFAFEDGEGTPISGYGPAQATNCPEADLALCGFDPSEYAGDFLVGAGGDNEEGSWSRIYRVVVAMSPLQEVTIGGRINVNASNGAAVDSFATSTLRAIILEPGGSITSASGTAYNVVVPEPSACALLGAAVLGLASLYTRRPRGR